MKTLKIAALFVLSLTIFPIFGFAQYYPNQGKADISQPGLSNEEQQRRVESMQRDAMRKQQEIFDRARANSAPVNLGGGNPIPRTPEEKAEIEARRTERAANWEKTRRMLLPPATYYRKFAEELKDRKYDLGRIFDEKNCDAGKTVAIEEVERCAEVPAVKGGGSLYSFRYRSNYSFFRADGWDIHRVGDKFVVGNDTVQAVIAKVGNVELEKVGKLPEADSLSDFKPAKTLAEIKEQNKALASGVTAKGFTYFNSAPIELDQTYLVRVVAYLKKDENFSLHGKPALGVDLLVAFKVVGNEKDGSLILLWRELKNELPRHVLAE